MKKHVAIFLVVLMAASVVSAAGVVSAKKTEPASYSIPYGVGQKWTAGQFNCYYTGFFSKNAMVDHFESADGNKATVDMSAVWVSNPNNEWYISYNSAFVGISYTLTGITDWDAVKDKPVAITVKMKYDIAVLGSSGPYGRGSGGVFGRTETIGPPYGIGAFNTIDGLQYYGEDQGRITKTITTTITQYIDPQTHMMSPLTVKGLALNGDSGDYSSRIVFGVGTYLEDSPGTTTVREVSCSMILHSITIEYL